jgi:hypothetical protein
MSPELRKDLRNFAMDKNFVKIFYLKAYAPSPTTAVVA